MKLHSSLIDKLIKIYETHSGHRNETRLRNVLAALDVSEYQRQTGEKIVVDSSDLDLAKDELTLGQRR